MGEDTKIIAVRRDGMVDTYAQTPTGVPNLIIDALSPLRIVATRVARVYVQSVLGILTAGMSGLSGGILPSDFLTLLVTAAQMSVAIATITALQNIAELLAEVDKTRPEWRA